MKKIYLSAFFSICSIILLAQNISISDNPLHIADSSAMLDISSDSKGLLVPRMASTSRMNISNPGTGLMVFDLDSKSFWCYTGANWIEIAGGATTMISDADGDTRIETEALPDEDAIRFIVDTNEVWKMTEDRLVTPNSSDNIFIGYEFFPGPSEGTRNVGIGGDALHGVDGDENTAIGSGSSVFSISGDRNTALGAGTLRLHQSGHHNVALGAYSLQTERYGWGNVAVGTNALSKGNNRSYLVAVGDSALYNNAGFSPGPTEGWANTAIGGRSMVSNVEGSYNTALGYQSLYSNESGDSNVGIGSGALFLSKSGNDNIAIGRHSMYGNETGSANVAMGHQSLQNNISGQRNVTIGNGAGRLNYSGTSNVFVGASAGRAGTSGSRNVFLGDSTGYNSLGSDNIYIGYHAGSINNVSNRLFLENSDNQSPLIYGEFDDDILGFNAKVGIGTHAPNTHLHIDQTTDASLTASGLIQLGPTNNENTVIDANEMQARNNGAAEDLNFNVEGGDINFGTAAFDQEFEFRYGDVLMSALGSSDLDRGLKWGEQNGQSTFGFIYDGLGTGDENRLHLREYLGTQSDIMTLKGNGFVGVNQPDPQTQLHISKVDQIGANPRMLFTNSESGFTTNDGFEIGLNPSVGPPPLAFVTNNARIWNNEDAAIQFGTDDLLRMTIDRDGQVGIGTSGPVDSKIHIHKASASDIPAKIRFTDNITGVGSPITVAGFEVGLTTNQDGALLHTGPRDILFITDNLDEQMRIKDNGNVIVHDQLSVGASASQGATVQIDSDVNNLEDPLRVRVGSSTKFMVHDNGSISMGTSAAASDNNIRISGRLGVGDGTPDVALDVVGDINYTGTITDVSDIRLKENIVQIPDALQKILEVRGVYYDHRKIEGMEFPSSTQIGVIAQEVESVFPELVHQTGEGYKSVDYVSMNAILIEGMREQQEMIQQLQSQVILLIEQVSSLKGIPSKND